MVMINHGISTGALFLLIGMIYERRHTRMIDAYGGIARVVPLFSAMLAFVSLSSIGVPGTNGFVGEFLVLLGSYRTYPVLAVIASTSVIIAAAYLLWAIQRILFNPLDKPENEHIPDLNRRELLLLAPLLAGIIWLGVYPAPVLRRMQPAAEQFVRLVETRAAMPTASEGEAADARLRSRDSVAAQRRAAARPAAHGRRDGPAAVGRVAERVRGASAQRRRVLHRPLRRDARRGARADGPARHGDGRSDRRRQFPLDGRRHHPARHHRRARARHRRQRSHRHDDGRDARAHPARVERHDAARGGARPDDRVPRHRADVDLGVRAGGPQPPQRAVGGRRAQVLPARRLLHRVPAVRHRARLRRHGHDRVCTRSACASSSTTCRRARCC